MRRLSGKQSPLLAVVRAWHRAVDHFLDTGFGPSRNYRDVRVRIAENPENLICKCLADFLDTVKVQENL